MAAIKAYLSSGSGNTVGDLAFSTRNATSDTALTERKRILSNGNVGIGTSAPALKFHVNGQALVGTNLIESNRKLIVNGSNQYWQYWGNSDLVAGTTGTALALDAGAATGNSYVSLQVLNSGGSAGGNLVLNTAGNVGVGSTSPAVKLDVAGAVSATGAITTSGALTASTSVKTAQVCDTSGANCSTPAQVAAAIAYTSPRPSFSVNKGGTNQTVTTDTVTLLTWSTEAFDTNNNFASNRFTPSVAGKYLITLAVHCGNSTNYCQSLIYKNGTQVATVLSRASNSTSAQTTAIIDMNGSTDYLEGYAVAGSGTSISGTATVTYFSGSLL